MLKSEKSYEIKYYFSTLEETNPLIYDKCIHVMRVMRLRQ